MVNELSFNTDAAFEAIASSPSVNLIEDSTFVDGDDIDGDGDSDVSSKIKVMTDADGDGDLEFPPGFYKAGTILDNDVQFNAKASNGWRFTIGDLALDTVSQSVDLNTTATHEFGHSHGLSHSMDNQSSATDGDGATMFPFIDTSDPVAEAFQRTLHTDDIAWSSYIYPEGTAKSGPAALTGGAECVFTYGTLKGWEALRVMAPDTCRPFSKDRKGMVLGEGAAMFVLEERGAARARGAEILGEIIGFGQTSDASDIVLPSADGAARAIAGCLEDARIRPEAVQYVNAHGTATAANDATETKALHNVFGPHAKKLMVSSTKSMHGHALGGAGAIELAATLIAMREGFVPPTANYNEPDPQCDLDYVPNEAREAAVDVAISNSFAFGGHNAVIAIRR